MGRKVVMVRDEAHDKIVKWAEDKDFDNQTDAATAFVMSALHDGAVVLADGPHMGLVKAQLRDALGVVADDAGLIGLPVGDLLSMVARRIKETDEIDGARLANKAALNNARTVLAKALKMPDDATMHDVLSAAVARLSDEATPPPPKPAVMASLEETQDPRIVEYAAARGIDYAAAHERLLKVALGREAAVARDAEKKRKAA